MKIGQLAEATGVSTKAIRYYEDIGVLPRPDRAPNGYRIYDANIADRISFIQDAQSAGLSLLEIQMVLDLRDEGESTCGHVITALEMHLADVDRQMAELQRTRQRLENIVERARSLDPARCDDPNRCQTIPTTRRVRELT
ncbi:MAG TPA: heavy metal-responsive transcriptional regulator [Acidimicrobiia bacterium]|nr:heavy metal-responsive transcriptional regulator [Acidimicrobiia bacterium]